MKSVTVRYFAAFRERAGVSEEQLQLSGNTALDVFEQTRDRHGSHEPSGHCKVAVNDRMVSWDTQIEDGDVVLLFPPVAGG